MTENDRLLLEEFKAAKTAFDFDTSEAIATECGRALQNLKYLDDLELRALAAIARLDFGPPSAWPDTKAIPALLKLAEQKLINAIS